MKTDFESDNYEFTVNPSQWVSSGWFIGMLGVLALITIYPSTSVALVSILMGFFAIGWLFNRLIIRFWEYNIHERTITERKGVFSVSTREIHYFRVKSIRIEEPFLFRLVGLKTYNLITSDPLIPIFRIYAIEDNGKFRDILKEKVTYWRKEMGVKETDFHNF